MKIANVEAIPFTIPYTHGAITYAAGSVLAAEHVLIIITTNEGVTGYAEAPARPFIYGESQESIVKAVNEWFKPQLLNMNIFETENIRKKLDFVAANNTAKAAIDNAVHDIIGKYLNIPCYKLLGNARTDVDVSWMLGISDNAVNEAVEMIDTYGFGCLMVKGGVNPIEDIQRIKEIRSAVGDDITLYIDINQGYDIPTSIRVLKEMEKYNVAWVEEPCPIYDKRGRRDVALSTSIPLLGDDSCMTPYEVAQELLHGALRVVGIKVARTGIVWSKKIAAICEGYNVPNLLGTQGDGAIGTMSNLHFAAATSNVSLPSAISYYMHLEDDIVEYIPEIKNGKIKLGSLPGMGIVIDEKKLNRYRVDKAV
ncbi:mandelate racemase/muconate lactonizing enzyme family protein [Bacillus sp. Marseille-P3661]|uniref:mandelate racemase/muconate lactonizing enzyme family protein n=1 Tax=Bacillus sp. Marseille-P3661 TaxID=1936234 RepID=UPI000C82B620|nr:mandelate racemase/muconate lactonizing enzyme family protein [Bacillus sp. Marseille-P3661]